MIIFMEILLKVSGGDVWKMRVWVCAILPEILALYVRPKYVIFLSLFQ